MSKTKDDQPFSGEITPSKKKNITNNQKFRKRRSKTYAEALQSIGRSNSDGEVYEPLKAPNVLEEENHDFHRMGSIDLSSIYTILREDELLGSDKSSCPPRICADTSSSSQNSSEYRNLSPDLDGEDHKILNILKEMFEGSKESEKCYS